MTNLAALNLSEGALSQQLTAAKERPNGAIKEVRKKQKSQALPGFVGIAVRLVSPLGLEPRTR
jgi:hypothetical protein